MTQEKLKALKKARSSKRKLQTKQELFLVEYLVDFNGTQAAIRAGYSAKSAATTANLMLRKPHIAAALDAEVERRAENSEVTQARVVEELAKIAFIDPRRLYDNAGNLLPVCKLDADVAAALSSIEAQESRSCGGVLTEVKKMRLIDKMSALNTLARHLGMLTDKMQIAGADGGPVEYKNLSDRELDAKIQILVNQQNIVKK